MSAAQKLRDALLETVAFAPEGEPAGNATVGTGRLDGRELRVALVENRFASGAIGVAEARALGAMFRAAAEDRKPVVLYLDSAGAKVSEGLRALGAFRYLYRTGLDAVFAEAPIAVLLGRNCFGGSSMLAHLGRRRLFGPESQLGMSGPAVIAAAAGIDVLDPAFRAAAESTISAARRTEGSPFNNLWSANLDLAVWLHETFAPPGGDVASRAAANHDALMTRIAQGYQLPVFSPVKRADLEHLFPEGCEASESHGVLVGTARAEGQELSLVGLVGPNAVRAARAWEFSEQVWKLRLRQPARVEVLLDCASHAPNLDDERAIQSEYIVDMALALSALARQGTRVGLTVLGRAGGGVYVALAAPADPVTAVHGAEIQVLPGAAVAAILGDSREAAAEFEEYRRTGVADEEARLGLMPSLPPQKSR